MNLMKINIEGGEYDLLEDLIASDYIEKIENVQVQFHTFVEHSAERMLRIHKALSNTHYRTYQYEFVWENWTQKQNPRTIASTKRYLATIEKQLSMTSDELLESRRKNVSLLALEEKLHDNVKSLECLVVQLREELKAVKESLERIHSSRAFKMAKSIRSFFRIIKKGIFSRSMNI